MLQTQYIPKSTKLPNALAPAAKLTASPLGRNCVKIPKWPSIGVFSWVAHNEGERPKLAQGAEFCWDRGFVGHAYQNDLPSRGAHHLISRLQPVRPTGKIFGIIPEQTFSEGLMSLRIDPVTGTSSRRPTAQFFSFFANISTFHAFFSQSCPHP